MSATTYICGCRTPQCTCRDVELIALRERVATLTKERDDALLGVGSAHENWRDEKQRADTAEAATVEAIATWFADERGEKNIASLVCGGDWKTLSYYGARFDDDSEEGKKANLRAFNRMSAAAKRKL